MRDRSIVRGHTFPEFHNILVYSHRAFLDHVACFYDRRQMDVVFLTDTVTAPDTEFFCIQWMMTTLYLPALIWSDRT